MTNKEIYELWIHNQQNLPIMMQPWWLDAVCAGKQWDVILVRADILPNCTDEQTNPPIIAALPYLIRKKWGIRFILMPQLTQINGVWLDDNRDWDANELELVSKYIANRLDDLKLSYYYQQYPVGNRLPDYLAQQGFKVKERITYRINDLSDLDKVINAFSKNKKRQLQKALSLHAERGWTAEQFYQFNRSCREALGKKISYSREFLLVLEQKTRKHRCSQILTIRNADNEVYAAALLVWDKKRLYYLVPVFSPEHKDSGAGALLVLESIKFCREMGLVFDFEGGNEAGLGKHYKQFGSEAYKYRSVHKYYHWWFWFANVYNQLHTRRFR